jgi:3',5'-cyclic AMP phosphodiesterase CpdA
VFAIPGNHDHYTKSAYRKRLFYDFFPERYDAACPYGLKKEGVTLTRRGKGWWLCLLDTALATSLFSSRGLFSTEREASLRAALSTIPAGERVILLNHFPLFSCESVRKELVRREALQKVLSDFPCVVLFLHGHTHTQAMADLRPSALPILLDSGSTAHRRSGTCHILRVNNVGCSVEALRNTCHKEKGYSSWEPFAEQNYTWDPL